MHFNADICTCENGSDKILSVCQCGPGGEIEHEVIIQRGPKELEAKGHSLGSITILLVVRLICPKGTVVPRVI